MKTKKLLLYIMTFMLCIIKLNAQNTPDVKMIYPKPTTDEEVLNLLSWQKIEYYDVIFTGSDLNEKDYYLVSKEIWNGKIKKVDTLLNSATFNLARVTKDTLKITLMSGKSSKKELRTSFDFGRFSIDHKYKSLPTDDYSMRVYGTQLNIKYNEPFYAFAYILPYEKDHAKYYCAVESSGENIESWGKVFNIKHYILYEMCFFDSTEKQESQNESFTITTN